MNRERDSSSEKERLGSRVAERQKEGEIGKMTDEETERWRDREKEIQRE